LREASIILTTGAGKTHKLLEKIKSRLKKKLNLKNSIDTNGLEIYLKIDHSIFFT